MRTAIFIIIGILMSAGSSGAQERLSLKHEGLRGPVRSVSVERAGVTIQNKVFIEGPRGRRLESYDKAGYKTSITYFNSDGSRGVKLVYTDIPERKVIERTDYDPDGTPGSKHTFGYDDKGNIIKSIYDDRGTKQSARMVDEYDDKGHILKHLGYGADDQIYRTDESKYKFDDKGNVIENLGYVNSEYVVKRSTPTTLKGTSPKNPASHLPACPFKFRFLTVNGSYCQKNHIRTNLTVTETGPSKQHQFGT